MDGNDRRRTQYGQPYQTPTQPRPLPGQPMGPPSSDRYGQATGPARSDAGSSAITPRPYVPSYPGYAFHEQQYGTSQMQGSSPMQGVQMQYSPAYIQEASRQGSITPSPSQQQQQQQQQHQYGQYGQGTMLPPVGGQSMYDNISYQQRQALEVMASQFAVPQYMPPSDQAALAGVGPSPSQYLTTQAEQSVYGNVPVTRAPVLPTYPSRQMDFPEATQHQQQPSESGAARDSKQEALQEGLRDYRQQIRSVFDSIISGRVNEASEKVLAATRWLASSVDALGLHHDDESNHLERIQLWTELNLCWEALGQKQKEVTEEALRTTRLSGDMLSSEKITSLIDELISMCDQLEQYGLVDFEMGIWEEQIIHIFTVCLDLLPGGGTGSGGDRQQAGSSS
ncbi:hypothetical protein PV08_04402 [Exophiala spinifera]|uniref:Uncharacterized protein n=1 Tax=Exophiala spinifera TaxID=91928 RepID=A0A0D1YPR8_9EURO|nr:uncharacterized protein PV08_04402 [Exophiala spinifera]KIW17211.1 hypothetical protein PV08_04402 [Exophiala spinifera]